MSARIAYIASSYPYVSHTFILREVQALRRRGIEVFPVTVRTPRSEDVIGADALEEAKRTHAILPPRLGHLLRAHLTALTGSPGAYLRTLLDTLSKGRLALRAKLWQLFYFGEAMSLWRHMADNDLQHVHAHHGNVATDLAMIATEYANRRRGTQTGTWSVTLHGPTELATVDDHKLALKTKRASPVVATSDYMRSQLVSLVGSAEEADIRVIRCGVAVSDYAVTEPDGSAGRSRPLRILFVGRLVARKGMTVLVEAVGLLRDRGLDTELILVGDGPDRADVEARIRELELGDRVRFTGALSGPEVTDWYPEADIFCLPSFGEGVPTVLMEAMATGLPVVSTWIAGTPELVTHREAGLLVPPARPDLLADALEELWDPELRRRLGTAARRKVEADYSLDASADRLAALFRTRIDGGGV